jgi:hypothetical protein
MIHKRTDDPPFHRGYGYRRGFGIVHYYMPARAWHALQPRFGCIYASRNPGVFKPLAALPQLQFALRQLITYGLLSCFGQINYS